MPESQNETFGKVAEQPRLLSRLHLGRYLIGCAWMIFLFVIFLGIYFTFLNPGLPQGAKQTLDKYVKTGSTYSITSAQKATNIQYYSPPSQEIWCVVIDKPLGQYGESHFVLRRTGLLWEIDESLPSYAAVARDNFLKLGCSNW